MSPQQRDSRQAAESAFVESLAQLEEQLMADEAENCQKTLGSREDGSLPQALTNSSSAPQNSPCTSESRQHASKSTTARSFSKSPEKTSHRQPTHHSLPQSKPSKSSAPQYDSLQAFEDAAADIERFMASRK